MQSLRKADCAAGASRLRRFAGRQASHEKARGQCEACAEQLPEGQGAAVCEGWGVITCHLPIKTVSEANRRDHFMVRARRVKEQRRTAAMLVPRFGLPCVVYMGAKDVERQSPNVFRMRLLGAEVRPVNSGTATLKDAMNEALRDWVSNPDDTFYIIGTAAGPHPYPAMVRDFQSIIGSETKQQLLEREGRLPDACVACIGGGSNAIGLFHPFIDDKDVRLIGVEAGGHGADTKEHAASLTGGRPGVLHGNRTYLLQNDDGQIEEGHSISAGLDYPGIGPEHAWLHDIGRAEYVSVTDDEALDAFQKLSRYEGIIPALEPAHAFAHVLKIAGSMDKDQILVMNLCGRGDKDVFRVSELIALDH